MVAFALVSNTFTYVVCKVVFNRPRDWVDVDAMLDADVALDVAEVLRWVGRIAGDPSVP